MDPHEAMDSKYISSAHKYFIHVGNAVIICLSVRSRHTHYQGPDGYPGNVTAINLCHPNCFRLGGTSTALLNGHIAAHSVRQYPIATLERCQLP